MDIEATVVAAAGAIGISSGLVFVAGRWIADRVAKVVDAKVEARHAAAAENEKTQHELALHKLQALEARVEGRLGVATSFEHAAYAAALPKKVEALEGLWQSTVALTQRMPRGLFMLDVVTDEEYPEARKRAAANFPNPANFNEAADHVSLLYGTERVDNYRPFVSNEVWQLFSAHRAFLGRVLLVTSNPETRLVPWYKDQLALRILSAVVPAGAKVDGIGSWYGARTALENALLVEVKRQLDGEGASARPMASMHAIDKAVREASVDVAPAPTR